MTEAKDERLAPGTEEPSQAPDDGDASSAGADDEVVEDAEYEDVTND